MATILSCSINAQNKKDTAYRNAVKLNIAAFVFRNVSWQYERQFKENWSIQMGANFKWGGDIPRVFGLGDFIIASKSTGLKGYAFTPEARYYFNPCDGKGAGSGLYTGIYSRMTRLYSDLNFHFWNGTEYVDAGGNGSLIELGLGLQLGYQVVIKKRIVVDLMFMGPRISSQWLNLEVDSQFTGEIIPRVEEELNKKLDYLGIDPVSLKESASTQSKFGFVYFRYAISFGFRF